MRLESDFRGNFWVMMKRREEEQESNSKLKGKESLRWANLGCAQNLYKDMQIYSR
jgi:hypothetical protein